MDNSTQGPEEQSYQHQNETTEEPKGTQQHYTGDQYRNSKSHNHINRMTGMRSPRLS